jgi:hypothetical protein
VISNTKLIVASGAKMRRTRGIRSICSVATVLISFYSDITVVNAFLVPDRPSVGGRALIVRQAATLPETATRSIGDQRKNGSGADSARLTKAKLLLEQFSDESVEDADSVRSAVAALPKFPNEEPFKKRLVDRNQKNKQPATSQLLPRESLVVPDSVWANGLLDGSDVVTRYAFRKGIKVAEPLVKYDPVAAEKLLFRQPTKWVVRNVQIAGPLGLWAAGVVADFVFQVKDNRRPRAQQLLKAISGLGPAIIKAGQALSSRPDLLPSEYLEELQKLQDDVPRFSNKLAFATVEEELGVQFDDIFELVQDEPIAAASIGQVYQARLRANGDLVALKIQRPNCEQIIALDLYVLRWWSGIYTGIFQLLQRDINLQSIIDDFGELIYREIDYVAEAANAQRFNELYAAVTDVFVPKIYSDLTTRKVLVMEWVDGFRLTDTASLSKYGLEKKKLVDTLVQCSLRQVLENGFFHAGELSRPSPSLFDVGCFCVRVSSRASSLNV